LSFENSARLCAVEKFKTNPIYAYGVDYYFRAIYNSPEWYAYAKEQAIKEGNYYRAVIIDESNL
jgi:hypothetical protein